MTCLRLRICARPPPIRGDARAVCAIFAETAELSDVGRRLDTHIFRKAREALTIGVEWLQVRASRLVRLRAEGQPGSFSASITASPKSDRIRARDVACADGALNSGKSHVFEPLESQPTSATGG